MSPIEHEEPHCDDNDGSARISKTVLFLQVLCFRGTFATSSFERSTS
jgi:hypothetical protein